MTEAPPPLAPASKRRPWALAILGVLAIGIIGVGIWAFMGRTADEAPEVAGPAEPATPTISSPTASSEATPTTVDTTLVVRPGGANTSVLAANGDPISSLAPVTQAADGVTVKIVGSDLVADAAVTASAGAADVTLTTTGCVGSACGLDIVVNATILVEELPADAAEAEPLATPAAERIVETETAGVFVVVDEIIVIADDTFDPVPVANELGVTFIGGVPATRTWQFAVPTGKSLEASVQALEAQPGVKAAVSHYLSDVGTTDAVYPTDWSDDGAGAKWHFEMIDAPTLWSEIRWTPDVEVGIVDFGIWPDHEDLEVLERYSFCEGDHCKSGLGAFFHGTHVAALACADDQGVGLVGMAWGCNLHAVDLYQAPGVERFDEGGRVLPAHLLSALTIQEAMNTVVDMDPDVVNMSLGYPVPGDRGECAEVSSQQLSQAEDMGQIMAEAVLRGTDRRNAAELPDIVWVVAAGNDCFDAVLKAPARLSLEYPNVVTVGSVDSDGQLSAFSNWGEAVTVAAPGGYYWGTGGTPSGVWSATTDCPDGTCHSSYANTSQAGKPLVGTSAAAPIVTGLVALMRQAAPDLPVDELVDCLTKRSQAVDRRHPHPQWETDEEPDLNGINLVNPVAAYNCATRGPTFSELSGQVFEDPLFGSGFYTMTLRDDIESEGLLADQNVSRDGEFYDWLAFAPIDPAIEVVGQGRDQVLVTAFIDFYSGDLIPYGTVLYTFDPEQDRWLATGVVSDDSFRNALQDVAGYVAATKDAVPVISMSIGTIDLTQDPYLLRADISVLDYFLDYEEIFSARVACSLGEELSCALAP